MPVRLISTLSTVTLIWATSAAARGPNSDCAYKNVDSTCSKQVTRGPVHLPPPVEAIYDGSLAGAPATGSAYWGFDFVSATLGIPSPVPRDMFINRSGSPISLQFSFDLPAGPCGTGCQPGMEFKLGASWNSFFPNIITFGTTAMTSLQVAPGQAYGFVISLWRATNPRIRVQNLGGGSLGLSDVGLTDFSVATPIAGSYFSCVCGDAGTRTCYSGTRFSNGLMGQWYQDKYVPWDAVGCN